jgi:hypothetical protein
VAAIGITAWVFGYLALVARGIGRWKLEAPSGSGNLYGAHLNMLWPVLVGLAVQSGRGWTRRLKGGLAAASIACVFLTFSRVAAGTAISLGAILLFRWKPRPFLMSIVVAAVATLALLWDPVLRLLEAYRFVGFEPDYPRTTIWTHAIAYARHHWAFGAAPGGGRFVLAALDMNHAHNDVVNTLLEAGLVPATLVLGLAAYLVSTALRCISRGGSVLYPGCALLSYVAYSSVATAMFLPELTLTMVFLVLMCRSLLHVAPDSGSSGRKPVPGSPWREPVSAGTGLHSSSPHDPTLTYGRPSWRLSPGGPEASPVLVGPSTTWG